MPSFDYDQMVHEVVFCALDIETTGPNPAVDKVLEVGMITFTMSSEIRTFSTLINPQVPIPLDVQAIHGISNHMVKDSPTVETVLPKVFAFMEDAILVVQNPLFDLTFLSIAGRMLNLGIPQLEALDTVKLAQITYPHFDNHKLSTLCRQLGIELDHHRALSDAMACMEVFRCIMHEHDPSGEWSMRDLVAFHGQLVKPHMKKRSVMKKGVFRRLTVGYECVIRYAETNSEDATYLIVPQEFIRYGKRWYVFAFCVAENSYRYFQDDRVLEADTVSTIFDEDRKNSR